MAITPKKVPWLVRMHYRMRTVAFALLFVAICLQAVSKSYPLSAWLWLGLAFLVYPHIQYWRSRRAHDAVRVEMVNLVIDGVLAGFVMAALEFPQWITFSATLGVLTDITANKGWRGALQGVIAMLVGALIWIACFGLKVSPDTDSLVAAFCMVGLTAYLLEVSNIGYARNLQLRHTREKLQLREQELLVSNQKLLNNLNEIAELQQQLHEQANRDPLTGLYNRRYLDATLERELARCKRSEQMLALLMIDIDYFKQTNDSYGHQAGDAILMELGQLLSGIARAGDVACRYGGEEFLLIMPNMGVDAAHQRAEELRASFAAKKMYFGDYCLQSTISIGIAVFPSHGSTAEALVKRADAALYEAKHGGRNCVKVYSL